MKTARLNPLPRSRGTRARTVRNLILFAMLVLLLAGASTLFLNNPATSSFFPDCQFHAITGLHCPGCGSTRALYQLLHGNFLAAFGHNLMLAAAAPLLFGLIGWERLARSNAKIPPAIHARIGWWFLASVFLFCLARNLPWYPFTLLAP